MREMRNDLRLQFDEEFNATNLFFIEGLVVTLKRNMHHSTYFCPFRQILPKLPFAKRRNVCGEQFINHFVLKNYFGGIYMQAQLV